LKGVAAYDIAANYTVVVEERFGVLKKNAINKK